MTKLQVALDLLSLEKAIDIATKVVRGGAHILEAGTPLIKAVGVECIRELRRRFSNVEIVADTKTMDAGAIEAELMISNGANYITVLGVAPNSTIKEAVRKAHELGGKVVVDLMNVDNPVGRAKELYPLEVDGFCIHTGIDVRIHRGILVTSLLDLVKEIKSELKDVSISIAGGIRLEHISLIKKYPVDIIIVGSAIVKSENPEEITKEFIKKLKD